MKHKTHISYTEEVMLSRRHKKPRRLRRYEEIEVEIAQAKEEDFPVAFRITQSLASATNSTKYVKETTEVRAYKGRLFSKSKDDPRRAGGFVKAKNADVYLSNSSYYTALAEHDEQVYADTKKKFPNIEVISSSRAEAIAKAEEYARDFVVFEGYLWEETQEPIYRVMTFGLGYNHGGTGLFLETYDGSEEMGDYKFSALERQEAIDYAVAVATRRGDTKDIPSLKRPDISIEVLMPEMVKSRKAHKKVVYQIILTFETSIEAPYEAGMSEIHEIARAETKEIARKSTLSDIHSIAAKKAESRILSIE